jgi:hypothetical protein
MLLFATITFGALAKVRANDTTMAEFEFPITATRSMAERVEELSKSWSIPEAHLTWDADINRATNRVEIAARSEK